MSFVSIVCWTCLASSQEFEQRLQEVKVSTESDVMRPLSAPERRYAMRALKKWRRYRYNTIKVVTRFGLVPHVVFTLGVVSNKPHAGGTTLCLVGSCFTE